MNKTEQKCAMCDKPVTELYACAVRFVHGVIPNWLSEKDEDNIMWMGGLCKDCVEAAYIGAGRQQCSAKIGEYHVQNLSQKSHCRCHRADGERRPS